MAKCEQWRNLKGCTETHYIILLHSSYHCDFSKYFKTNKSEKYLDFVFGLMTDRKPSTMLQGDPMHRREASSRKLHLKVTRQKEKKGVFPTGK